ncbi:hypothetical protein [Mesorhizobium sp. J428]|uniref:hypothetical protein n=1 Tax=Mesorhizobium sp. J428 TaxID=2898440 RepID=UPI0021510F6F|nr:hypothetical protein [Mesorhizobium sp. J428]MCR5859721.1 hypothetical protein [Mesorhizobium sp. J428]
MKFMVTGGTAEIGTDMALKLTPEQSAARAFAIEEIDKGLFRPKQVVQFKAGETVEIVDTDLDDMPRTLASLLQPIEIKGKGKGKGKKDETPLKTDGPTVEEYVAAGYSAKSYPPKGYASRSSDEDIAAAIKAEAGA